MVIRPYRVRYLNDPDGESYTQHVVYCEHWERATWLALYLRARIRKRREIECLIQSGKAWSERVEGWFFRPSASLNKANGVLRHAHGPRPKARSTILASPTMPAWRANIPELSPCAARASPRSP